MLRLLIICFFFSLGIRAHDAEWRTIDPSICTNLTGEYSESSMMALRSVLKYAIIMSDQYISPSKDVLLTIFEAYRDKWVHSYLQRLPKSSREHQKMSDIVKLINDEFTPWYERHIKEVKIPSRSAKKIGYALNYLEETLKLIEKRQKCNANRLEFFKMLIDYSQPAYRKMPWD